jgi:hypothetical protein
LVNTCGTAMVLEGAGGWSEGAGRARRHTHDPVTGAPPNRHRALDAKVNSMCGDPLGGRAADP